MTHQFTSAVGTLLHPYYELRMAQQPPAWDPPRVSRRWDIKTPDAVAKRPGFEAGLGRRPPSGPLQGLYLGRGEKLGTKK